MNEMTWAKEQLQEIMNASSLKTKYKTLLTTPLELEELEKSLLIIAKAKSVAYKNAQLPNHNPTELGFNSVNKYPELAEATLQLQHNMIDLTEISIFPDSL
jgi:hypothetical protein